jgi:NitT/TauT family transport system substrate-binding protein
MKNFKSIIGLLAVCLIGSVVNATAGTIRAGYLMANGAPLAFLADDAGLFRKEGINVELIPFASSPDGLNALNNGRIDVAVTFGTCAPLTFISKGADFVIIGGHLTGGHSIAAKPSVAARFRSIKDFRGLTVASPRMYTADVIFRGALVKAGLSVGSQVKIIEVKNGPAALEALKAGKVDAAVLVYGDSSSAIRAGFKIIRWSNDLFPNHPCCRLVAKRATVHQRQKDLTAFLKAMIQAERIKDTDPKRFVSTWSKRQNIDFARSKEILLEPHILFSIDPNEKGVVRMWNFMKSVGYLRSNTDIRRNINTALYKTALDDLTKHNPSDRFYAKLQTRFKEQNSSGVRSVQIEKAPVVGSLTARLEDVPDCCR